MLDEIFGRRQRIRAGDRADSRVQDIDTEGDCFQIAKFGEAAAAGRAEEALAIHRELLPLMQAMTLETNPIPAKAAMAMTGRMTDEIRLPLTPMTEEGRKQLGQVLAEQGLL